MSGIQNEVGFTRGQYAGYIWPKDPKTLTLFDFWEWGFGVKETLRPAYPKFLFELFWFECPVITLPQDIGFPFKLLPRISANS